MHIALRRMCTITLTQVTYIWTHVPGPNWCNVGIRTRGCLSVRKTILITVDSLNSSTYYQGNSLQDFLFVGVLPQDPINTPVIQTRHKNTSDLLQDTPTSDIIQERNITMFAPTITSYETIRAGFPPIPFIATSDNPPNLNFSYCAHSPKCSVHNMRKFIFGGLSLVVMKGIGAKSALMI